MRRVISAVFGWYRAHVGLANGLLIVGALLVVSLLEPLLVSISPTRADASAILTGPSAKRPFGTDDAGFDVFARVLYAPRTDLVIALVATAGAVLVGVPLGLLAGFYSGWRNLWGASSYGLMRVMDVVQAFPVFILALALVAGAGRSVTNVIIAIIFVNTPAFVRLTRAEVLRLRERAHVDAAFLVGYSRRRIAVRHILPLSIGPVLVQFSVTAGFAILLAAGLGFIGAGVRPPTPEWGQMIASGAGDMITGAWWASVFPGIFLGLAVFGLALVGDGVGKLIARG